MGACLLVGAGAEVDLGLPSGNDYLLDTYYTMKPALYDALKEYYAGRRLPEHGFPTYRRSFLFNSASVTFQQLLDSMGDKLVAQLLETDYETSERVSKLTSDQKKLLFGKLIRDDSNFSYSRDEDRGLSQYLGDERECYGTLELLFSSLLQPKANEEKFWRIVNFYWSAFFSIFTPIVRKMDVGVKLPEADTKEYYSAILHNLSLFTTCLGQEEASRWARKPSYYSTMRGKFDAVLTTNYTPFAGQASKLGEPIYLSGRLDRFESASNYELYKPSDLEDVDRCPCPFPFLMACAPVKPIINTDQIEEYHRAIVALHDSNILLVLGYSFRDGDAHISTLVRNYLNEGNEKRVVYCNYVSDIIKECSSDDVINSLSASLRIPIEVLRDKCEVINVENCSSPVFQKVLSEIA